MAVSGRQALDHGTAVHCSVQTTQNCDCAQRFLTEWRHDKLSPVCRPFVACLPPPPPLSAILCRTGLPSIPFLLPLSFVYTLAFQQSKSHTTLWVHASGLDSGLPTWTVTRGEAFPPAKLADLYQDFASIEVPCLSLSYPFTPALIHCCFCCLRLQLCTLSCPSPRVDAGE